MPGTLHIMTDTELIWLAAWLEGEGCFQKGPPSQPHMPRIMANTTDEDVALEVARLFQRKVTLVRKSLKNAKHKDLYQVCMVGKPAVDLMLRLRPLMFSRRRAAIDAAIDSYYVKENPAKYKPTLTLEEATFVRDKLIEGVRPKTILTDFYSEFGKATTRDVIRSIRRGYRTLGLEPVSP